jgi:hypothetical protein
MDYDKGSLVDKPFRCDEGSRDKAGPLRGPCVSGGRSSLSDTAAAEQRSIRGCNDIDLTE